MNHLGTKIMEALQGLDKVYAPIKAELGALEHKITAGRQSVEDLQRYGELDFACRPFLEVVEGLIFVQELMKEAGDKVFNRELVLEAERYLAKTSDILLQHSFSQPYDSHNAVLTLEIGQGKGGLERVLLDLIGAYDKFTARKGLSLDEVEVGDSYDRTIRVIGRNSYGLFRTEHGVHRFIYYVADGKKQTGFITVTVVPEIENPEIVLNEKDLRYEFLKATGPGGQHNHKNATAARITHRPSGLSAIARSRSRAQSIASAKAVLTSRVQQLSTSSRDGLLESFPPRIDPSYGSCRTRTYDFTGNFIRDDRSEVLSTDIDAFFKGIIDPFIYAAHGIPFSVGLNSL